MLIKSVTPQNGEYVKIEYNEDGETYTSTYIRFSPTYWEIDWEDNFIFERVPDCKEQEKLYQEFISQNKLY